MLEEDGYFLSLDIPDVSDHRDDFALINQDVDFTPNDIKWELNMFLHFPLKEGEFKEALEMVKSSGMVVKFHFIVESEENIAEAEKVIEEYGLTACSFLPYYNGSNLCHNLHEFKRRRMNSSNVA